MTRSVANAVVAEALEWVGTPYRHQGHAKGVGCDCIGLVRGIWRAVLGCEIEPPGPYAPDWAEAGERDFLLEAMRRHFIEKPKASMAEGDVILFRWRPHLPAKHAAILIGPDRFVHAYQGHAVTASRLVPQWRRRIAAAFSFPEAPMSN